MTDVKYQVGPTQSRHSKVGELPFLTPRPESMWLLPGTSASILK